MTAASTYGSLRYPVQFASLRSERISFVAPRSGDEADALLERADWLMRFPEHRKETVGELVRFLGVHNPTWDAVRRARLGAILANGGDHALTATIARLEGAARYETIDAVEEVLLAIARGPSMGLLVLGRLYPKVDATARASILRVMARAGGREILPHFASGLADASSEVRDAAAVGLSRIGGPEARLLLEGRLGAESEASVLEAIRTALTEIDSA